MADRYPDEQAEALANAMMAQRTQPQPQFRREPSLWERIMAMLGQDRQVPQYMPTEMMPADAREIQRRKEEILRQAMGGQ